MKITRLKCHTVKVALTINTNSTECGGTKVPGNDKSLQTENYLTPSQTRSMESQTDDLAESYLQGI